MVHRRIFSHGYARGTKDPELAKDRSRMKLLQEEEEESKGKIEPLRCCKWSARKIVPPTRDYICVRPR